MLIDDETNLERRGPLREERSTLMHELHRSLKYDRNKFWEEKAKELEEAGRKGESLGMFAAVGGAIMGFATGKMIEEHE